MRGLQADPHRHASATARIVSSSFEIPVGGAVGEGARTALNSREQCAVQACAHTTRAEAVSSCMRGAGGRGRGGVLYALSRTFRRLEEVVVAVRKEPPGELHSLQPSPAASRSARVDMLYQR